MNIKATAEVESEILDFCKGTVSSPLKFFIVCFIQEQCSTNRLGLHQKKKCNLTSARRTENVHNFFSSTILKNIFRAKGAKIQSTFLDKYHMTEKNF